MSHNVINKRAHKLAHKFVGQNFDEITPSLYDMDRSSLVFNVELWIVSASAMVIPLHGIARVKKVRWSSDRFYSNDFAHPSHDTVTRLDIAQDLGYALLDYVGASLYEMELFDTWYCVTDMGRRRAGKFSN